MCKGGTSTGCCCGAAGVNVLALILRVNSLALALSFDLGAASSFLSSVSLVSVGAAAAAVEGGLAFSSVSWVAFSGVTAGVSLAGVSLAGVSSVVGLVVSGLVSVGAFSGGVSFLSFFLAAKALA